MGYLGIPNLYKDPEAIKEWGATVYALEKVHGTSAHVSYNPGTEELNFSSGGEKHTTFLSCFDANELKTRFKNLVHNHAGKVVVFGEAYGGKQQGQGHRYGPKASFIVFDIKVGDEWLTTVGAAVMAEALGLEFVPYKVVPNTIEALNAERDAPSTVAVRRGITEPKSREGIVIRPMTEEGRTWDGKPLRFKHRVEEFSETATPRSMNPEDIKVLSDAVAIANEWVTAERLNHVLDGIPGPYDMSMTPRVIREMIADVEKDSKGINGRPDEVVFSDAARKEIGKAAARLFKRRVTEIPT